METGDNEQGFVFPDEEQRVRKAAQKCAAHVLEHDRKLPGVGAEALDEGVNRLAEMSAESGGFAFVPVLRLDDFPARALSENNPEHYGQRSSSSAFKAAHVTPLCRS